MYELILMMALSNGPGTTGVQPEADTLAVKTYGLHGHQEYRHRRRGCCGGGYGGCSGGGYGGCYGGYAGCTGGYGGYGCAGGYAGCTGGYGGYGCAGGYAMYGGPAGTYATFGDYSGFGGYAGYSGSSPMIYSSAYGPGYFMPATNFNQSNLGEQRGDTSANANRADANQATLVVDLPANARLTIDGQPTQLTSATRTFITPPLQPGQEYYYDLKAELNRDGKPLAATKRVTIRPGQESRVRLDFSGQTATTED